MWSLKTLPLVLLRWPRGHYTLCKTGAVCARRLSHDRCARRRALRRQSQEHQKTGDGLCAANGARQPHFPDDRCDRDLEFVTTKTETEALLLEANLIKRLRPRFNVLLRDDKSFPYILITTDHWAPQILKHRGARTKPGHYYGPFASAGAVNRTHQCTGARFSGALLLGFIFRGTDAAMPALSNQTLFGALYPRGRFCRL